MDEYGTPHLPGMVPVASWVQEVLLMPDGSVWHISIEGRDPQGALVVLEGFPRSDEVDDNMRLIQGRARFLELVNDARSTLRRSYNA